MRMIEDYLDGLLGDEENRKFVELLGRDKELADLVKMHTEIRESIRDHALNELRNKLKKAGDAFRTHPGVNVKG